jgi:small conductance mechanosensitive channel
MEQLLEQSVTVPTRSDPSIDLEEFDGQDVVVRISATPVDPADGPELADQVVATLDRLHIAQAPG